MVSGRQSVAFERNGERSASKDHGQTVALPFLVAPAVDEQT